MSTVVRVLDDGSTVVDVVEDVRPDPKLPRVKRVEALARRAEAAALERQPDIQLQCLAVVVAEMGRELYRMAYALDGVV